MGSNPIPGINMAAWRNQGRRNELKIRKTVGSNPIVATMGRCDKRRSQRSVKPLHKKHRRFDSFSTHFEHVFQWQRNYVQTVDSEGSNPSMLNQIHVDLMRSHSCPCVSSPFVVYKTNRKRTTSRLGVHLSVMMLD